MDQYLVGFLIFAEIQKKMERKTKKKWKHGSENSCNNKQDT